MKRLTAGQKQTAKANVNGFRGNKRALPNKTCVQCLREMTWRRKWAHNWDQVRYCSDACRRLARNNSRPVGAADG